VVALDLELVAIAPAASSLRDAVEAIMLPVRAWVLRRKDWPLRHTALMRRSQTRAGATILIALALGTLAARGGSDSDKSPKKPPRNSAKARCAGAECRVRIVCKGRVYVRLGPAPVAVRTSKSAFRTTIVADFAGSKDAVVRC